MPSYNKQIDVPGKSSQELYEAIAQKIDGLAEKIGGGANISRDAGKRQFDIKHAMFSATLICEDGRVRLDGKLSLMAAPFKSKIDESIDRFVEKAFRNGSSV